MPAQPYKLDEHSVQYDFRNSRAKIQIFGGAFANGKTTAAVVSKALEVASSYPGCNILIARATYPKLNDTIRRVFYEWCPTHWIKRKILSGAENMCELTNGSTINFRYISQQGKSTESSTSNLLSATYDLIIVDQMEDPEIMYKDFLDLMGRLRGNTPYDGNDPTMPLTGPRWLVLCINPTRNWVYKKLIKPMHDLRVGINNPDLQRNPKTGEPLIELFESDTYANSENLAEDYIEGLEATYQGQMRERYLLGKWGAFEGLVYPQYDQSMHVLGHDTIMGHLDKLLMRNFVPTWVESYDHGIASPACYSLGFVDDDANVFDVKGFYQNERTPEQLASMIKEVRSKFLPYGYNPDSAPAVLADPQIFKRTSGNAKTVGVSVAGMFGELGVRMTRANNDITSGIAKVQSYLNIDAGHKHPITGAYGAPRLFFCADQHWIDDEIVDYIWHRDTNNDFEDKPMDRNDHAMDRIKYMLTNRPRIALFRPIRPHVQPKFMSWREHDHSTTLGMRRHRHAA